MARFVLRIWLPDRPGALGAVASRIGAVRGDVVGIDILERGAGRVIDELVVELPDDELVPLLIGEVSEVDGVDVEEIHPAAAALLDPRLDALETAALLVAETTTEGLLEAFAAHAHHDFDADWSAVIGLSADWSAVIGLGAPVPLVTVGTPPSVAWLGAFVEGSRHSVKVAAGECGPDDVAWAHLATADLALVLGRRGRPFRARERRQAAALARIADQRWLELSTGAARRAHPSVS